MKMLAQWMVLTVLNLAWIGAVVADQVPNRDSIPLITLFLGMLNLGMLLVGLAELLDDRQ